MKTLCEGFIGMVLLFIVFLFFTPSVDANLCLWYYCCTLCGAGYTCPGYAVNIWNSNYCCYTSGGCYVEGGKCLFYNMDTNKPPCSPYISGTTCYYGGTATCTASGWRCSWSTCSICSDRKTADCTATGCSNYRCIKGSCNAECNQDGSGCPTGKVCNTGTCVCETPPSCSDTDRNGGSCINPSTRGTCTHITGDTYTDTCNNICTLHEYYCYGGENGCSGGTYGCTYRIIYADSGQKCSDGTLISGKCAECKHCSSGSCVNDADGTSCGTQSCPSDYCSGTTYYDYPPSCTKTCSSGVCQSCSCSATPYPCDSRCYSCTPWSNVGCEVSPCASDQMKQTRNCQGCDVESQCVSDPSCDITPPTTTIQCNDASCITGWYKANVKITLSCSDTGGNSSSGCNVTKYCVDQANTCNPTTTYTAAFYVTSEGTNYVRYYSVDNRGNVESTKSQTVRLDKTNPSVIFNSPVAGSWQTKNFPINISDNDALSGLSRCEYNTTTKAWTLRTCNSTTSATVTVGSTGDCRNQGTNSCTVWVRAIDNAGNVNTTSRSFSIDYEAPKYSNQGQNATLLPPYESIKLSVLWYDALGLSSAILATNETGVWQNKTVYFSPMSLSGTSAWSNFTWQNSSVPIGTIIAWRVYANDTPLNQWNETPVTTFTTFKIINVSTSVSINPVAVNKGDRVNVTVGFNDERFNETKKVYINLTIDYRGTNRTWEGCFNVNVTCPGMNQNCAPSGGNCTICNATSGNFSAVANCIIPNWVDYGTRTLRAVITHYSSSITLKAESEIYVEGEAVPTITPLQKFLIFIRTILKGITGFFIFPLA